MAFDATSGRAWRLAAWILIGWAASAAPVLANDENATPESVLKAYLGALYARDADAAYALLSSADQAEKTLPVYRSEHGGFSGAALAVSRELAAAIRYGDMSVTLEDNRATAKFEVRLPDANSEVLAPIVQAFDSERLAELGSTGLAKTRERIQDLARTASLPYIDSPGERWELVREGGQWRVFVNWAGSIEVYFDAFVANDLGWQFEPVRRRVLAQPGQTIQMAYHARNLRASASTGKARHIIGPQSQKAHFEIVSCFCFIEQSLEPGEEVEMPLTFRVSFDTPDDIKRFDVRYEFYPLADFPQARQ